MKGLTLTTKEQSRIQVLNGVLEGKVTAVEAAGLMEVSERHTWRLLAAYRKEGPAAVAHGNRGRKPATTTCLGTQQKVRELAEGPYAGLNHTHLTEMLAEREGIDLSRSTMRRILLAGGLRSPRIRRASKRYSRRERYPQEGMLLQIDGSRHDWLEGRGPYLTLVGAVDDATGTVPFALFRQQEDAQGYMLMLRDIIDHHGVPLALYSDRHGIFQRSPKEPESLAEQLRGRRDPTQFGRALEELDIQLIMAHTPQAKGRIERVWGTFQDRLVSELAARWRHQPSSRPTTCSGTSCRASTRRVRSRLQQCRAPPIANSQTASALDAVTLLQVHPHRGQRQHRPVQRRHHPALCPMTSGPATLAPQVEVQERHRRQHQWWHTRAGPWRQSPLPTGPVETQSSQRPPTPTAIRPQTAMTAPPMAPTHTLSLSDGTDQSPHRGPQPHPLPRPTPDSQ